MSAADPQSAPPPWALWAVERFVRRHYTAVACVLGTGVLANEVAKFGLAFDRWDWLLVSGFGTLLAAAHSSLLLPDRVSETVLRLARRGALHGDVDMERLLHRVHRTGRRGGAVVAVAFAVIVVITFVIVFGDQLGGRAVLAVVEAVAAVPVGMFVGRAIVYGRLGRYLADAGGRVSPEPRHLDGAAGLLPVGELYFSQARLLAAPATYLAAWWFLIPLLGDRYLHWRDVYVGLLAILAVGAVLVFVVPMLWFHRLMQRAQRELQVEADELSQRAAGGTSDVDAERYAAIEAMPTWPVDARIRRRFGIGNLVLLPPVLAQALGASDSTQSVLSQLGRIIVGQS